MTDQELLTKINDIIRYTVLEGSDWARIILGLRKQPIQEEERSRCQKWVERRL